MMTTATKVDGPIRGAASFATSSPDPTFDEVVDRFENDVYRLCLQLTADRSQADELYCELLANACESFADLDGTANLRVWIFNIATSVFLRRHRPVAGNQPLDPLPSISPYGIVRMRGDGSD